MVEIYFPDGTKLSDYLKTPMSVDLDMANKNIKGTNALFGDDYLALGYNDGIDRVTCYLDNGSNYGIQLYEDRSHDLGSASYRWELIRGFTITSGDLGFEEETCAKCGKRFEDGDKLILVVKTIHEYGTLTVPMHLHCADTPKVTIQLPIVEMELEYNFVDGITIQTPVRKMEQTVVRRMQPKKDKKGKDRVKLDKKLGIWKDKKGNVIPTESALEEVDIIVKKPKIKMIDITL